VAGPSLGETIPHVVCLRVSEGPLQPAYWLGASKDDVRSFPEPVLQTVGFALFRAHNQAAGERP
jgi:hypothetical protein